MAIALIACTNMSAQLAYNQTFSESDWDNESTKIESSGANSWNDGICLAGKVSGFDWSDKYVIIAISSAGIPNHLTSSTSVQTGATKISFKIFTSDDNQTFAEVWNSAKGSNTIDIKLSKTTRYIKLQYSGNLRGYYKDLKVTNLTYEHAATPATLDFGSEVINSQDTSSTTAVEWCDIPAMEYSISGDDASQFSVSVANNSSALNYGTATYTVTYKHDKGGTHHATLLINSQSVALTGTTLRGTQTITWNDDLYTIPADTLVTLTADALTPVSYSSSDSTVAYVKGNQLYILSSGAVTIIATAQESDDYEAVSVTKDIIITAVTPAITTLPVASAIFAGETLATAVLTGGMASVDGTFLWAISADTVLFAGEHRLPVRFMPTNLAWYNSIDTVITLVVSKKQQTVTWNDIPGILLLDTVVEVKALAQTAIAYISSDSTVAFVTNDTLRIISRGIVTITAEAAETDLFYTASEDKQFVINALTPVITTLPTASDIFEQETVETSTLTGGEVFYGNELVKGTFFWAEDIATTILSVGTHDNLHIVFTPNDLERYNILDAYISLTVNERKTPTSLTLTASESAASIRKEIRNGQLYIIRGNDCYDATGHQLHTQP